MVVVELTTLAGPTVTDEPGPVVVLAVVDVPPPPLSVPELHPPKPATPMPAEASNTKTPLAFIGSLRIGTN
jgi:hypothetical protein